MFVDTFIRRPILATVCSLVIILAGAIAIPTLPIAQFPRAGAAAGHGQTRSTTAPAPQIVETAVTTPLEQAINGVEGMQYMTSTSGNDGTCAITVTFDVDAQPRHRRRRRAEPHLAGRGPAAERGEAGRHLGHQGGDSFVLAAGVYAENGEYDPLFISNYLDGFVKDELKRVPGVGDVIHLRRAQVRDAAVARSRPARRPRHHRRRVVNALREQNVQVAAGQVGQPPAPRGQTYPDQRPRRRPAHASRRSSTTSS